MSESMTKRTPHRSRGISVIEIAIGVSIAALAVAFTAHAIARFASSGRENLNRARAALLAEEGIEVMRYLRDSSWTSLSSMTVGTPYFLNIATTTIATTTSSSLIDNTYRRTVTLYPAYRANSGEDLVASTSAVAKTIDTDTKLVTVSVSWGTPTSTVSLSTYLTNI